MQSGDEGLCRLRVVGHCLIVVVVVVVVVGLCHLGFGCGIPFSFLFVCGNEFFCRSAIARL